MLDLIMFEVCEGTGHEWTEWMSVLGWESTCKEPEVGVCQLRTSQETGDAMELCVADGS